MSSVAVLPRAERPYQAEALSSWLARLGAPFELRPRQLLHALRIGAFANRALDQPKGPIEAVLVPRDFVRLAQLARCDLFRVPRTSAADREWQLQSERMIAVCAQCLHEDREAGRSPYVRQDWRHAWCTFCTRHRRPLVALPATSLAKRSWSTVRSASPILPSPPMPADIAQCALEFEHMMRGAIRGRAPSTSPGAPSPREFLRILADITTFALEKFEWKWTWRSVVDCRGRALKAQYGALFEHQYTRRRAPWRARATSSCPYC